MAVLFQEIIRKKRDGQTLTPAEIADFVSGIEDGSASDAHIAAFGMAVYFQGMDRDETVALTMAMRDSGDVMHWPDFGKPIIDKHSTGGVGDNVSLMLAPMAAACGVAVPMISGRGLGHTGGTLDKMEAIPGYTTQPGNALFNQVTEEIGCAIIGQTANLAPADKRFYGVRDVTATVENLSLITASILSKKLAAGLDWLVLDVKFGNGAFMDSLEKAEELAESLVAVANGAGTKTVALLTDMNESLASAVGNAVEVKNAVEFLNGKHRDPRLEEVTVQLVTHMVHITKESDDIGKIEAQVRAALANGRAAEIFGQMVTALGGPDDFMERYEAYLPKAPIIRAVKAPTAGYVTGMNTREIGVAVVQLGGGRRSREDEVDQAVGLSEVAAVGDFVNEGDILFVVHARDEASADAAQETVLSCFEIGKNKPAERPVIAKIIG